MIEHIQPPINSERYEELQFLGAGGMGSVYKARDKKLKRNVAIKFLKEEISKEMQGRARIRREAQILAKLRHPGLVRIYEFDSTACPPYIVMELLEGQSLTEILDERDILSPKEGLALIHQLAAALAYLHNQKLIHRDIKPANLFRTNEGRWLIMDFGLVRTLDATRITVDGQLLGTLAFYPPELFRGDEFTAASDIYQVGLVLHLALSGKHLHPIPKDSMAWLNEVIKPTWKPLPIDKEIEEPLHSIISSCCTVEPAKRLGDGNALLNLVNEPLEETTPKQKAKTRPTKTPTTKKQRKVEQSPNKIPLYATIVVILLCLLLAFRSRKVENSSINVPPSVIDRVKQEKPVFIAKPLLVRQAEEDCETGSQVFGDLKFKDLVIGGSVFVSCMKRAAEHWIAAFEKSNKASSSAGAASLVRPTLIRSATYLLVLHDAQRVMVARGGNILRGLKVPPVERLQLVINNELPRMIEPFLMKETTPDMDKLAGLLTVYETHAMSRRWKLSHYMSPTWRNIRFRLPKQSAWSLSTEAVREITKGRLQGAECYFREALNKLPQATKSYAKKTPSVVLTRLVLLDQYVRILNNLPNDEYDRAYATLEDNLTTAYAELATTSFHYKDVYSFYLTQLELIAGLATLRRLQELDSALLAMTHLLDQPRPAWFFDRQLLGRRKLQKLINKKYKTDEFALPGKVSMGKIVNTANSALEDGTFNKQMSALRLFSALSCTKSPPKNALFDYFRCVSLIEQKKHPINKRTLMLKSLCFLSLREHSNRWPSYEKLTAEQIDERNALLDTLQLWLKGLGKSCEPHFWSAFTAKLPPGDPISLAIKAAKKHGPEKRTMLLQANKLLEEMLPLLSPQSRMALERLKQNPLLQSN